MEALIKGNKAYCPKCYERNYKILPDKHKVVNTSKGKAIEFIARCKCKQEFTFLAQIKIDSETIFTESSLEKSNQRETFINNRIKTILKQLKEYSEDYEISGYGNREEFIKEIKYQLSKEGNYGTY